ncbi:hypothetical protein L7F22_050480 [Adiantum nelumboides]|nr:hypothetical protein [Adiantum nelumboides]
MRFEFSHHASVSYWISTADRMKEDFFAIHRERSTRSMMRAIRDGSGALHTDPNQVLDIVTDFYEAWIRGVFDIDLFRVQLCATGLPLAPYLFLFVAETMSDFIRLHQPALRGLLMPVSDEPNLIDQEYADDTLLFLHYTLDALDTIRYALERNTKVILLDSNGSQSKSIARALKKAGIQIPYRIDGGFKAWEANGLRVKQVGLETPLTIIKEETEAILDEVKPTPFGIGAAALGVFAGLYALFEWEKTLQFLGVICICQVLYMRLNSYENAEDAKDDLKLLLQPFSLVTQGIVWAAGAVEPSKLQLATSPSTSAVQDRVLQAAAKHGPLPSEADQEQQEVLLSGDDNESKAVDGNPVVQD